MHETITKRRGGGGMSGKSKKSFPAEKSLQMTARQIGAYKQRIAMRIDDKQSSHRLPVPF